MYLSDHHGDGRLAIWCAAPEGAEDMLLRAEPEHYFKPPYVGHRGWLGVNLDAGLQWEEIAGICEGACLVVAPRSLSPPRGLAAGAAL